MHVSTFQQVGSIPTFHNHENYGKKYVISKNTHRSLPYCLLRPHYVKGTTIPHLLPSSMKFQSAPVSTAKVFCKDPNTRFEQRQRDFRQNCSASYFQRRELSVFGGPMGSKSRGWEGGAAGSRSEGHQICLSIKSVKIQIH